MGYGKKNIINLDPLSYNIGLLGEGGIGKTTIIYQMCEQLSNGKDGSYLFIECGKEDGADAIANINYINCPDWDSDYDELNNSVGFQNLIDDILENKDTDYPNLKTVVIDTYDQLREIVVPLVIKMYNKEHPDQAKKTSIKEVYGGYMAGDDKCDDIVLDRLWSLKNVGVHFILIGHVKQRDITDVGSGTVYSQLTTDMSLRSFNKIKTKLHFLGLASIDRDFVKEKKGKKEKNVIKGEARKITFRDDNYALDSKSRFAEIAEEIPFDVNELIKAMQDAILAEANKCGNINDLKKQQKQKEIKIVEKASQYSANKKENKVDPERNAELIEYMTGAFKGLDDEKKAPIKEIMKTEGLKNFAGLSEYPTTKVEEIKALFD